MSKFPKLFACFTMILAFAVSGFAIPPEDKLSQKPPKYEIKEKLEKLDKELNLTDEQKTKMDILRQADREKRKELITQLIEKKQALDDELLKAEYDKTTVEGLTNDIRRISADIAQLQIDGKIQIRNILTLEQFQKIEQHKIKMREKIKSKKFKKRS